MPIISKDPTEFQQRHGLEFTPKTERPRLNLLNFKLFDMPLARNELDPSLLLDTAGTPLNDRGATGPWPPAQNIENE